MWHCNAAEHDRAIAGKSVNVETHAGPRNEPACEPLLGALKVCRGSQLLERKISSNRGDAHSSRSKNRRFIRRRRPRPAVIGLAKRIEPKSLRGLDAYHPCSINKLVEAIACACQRIPEGKDGRRALKEFERCHEPLYHRRGTKGPGRIVEEDGIAIDVAQPGTNRIRSILAALNEGSNVEALESCGCEFLLSAPDDDAR
jgi:hypothetical protein